MIKFLLIFTCFLINCSSINQKILTKATDVGYHNCSVENNREIDTDKIDVYPERGQWIAYKDGKVFSGRLSCFAKIPVFKIRLEKSTIIKDSDLDMKDIPVQAIKTFHIRDISQIIGNVTTKQCNENQMISKWDIGKHRIIKKGDLVTIEAGGNGLEVRTQGIAEDEGSIGDTIRIKHDMSTKKIYGIVRENKIVKVGITANSIKNNN
jgi:flagella basal body P-ring formation protein FlgA